MRSMELLTGIEPLIERYEAFLLDQFGVLHDGVRPFPGTLAALDAIREAGRKVIILSNSGKRSAPNMARLEKMGISRYLYDDLLSSGEAAWVGLQNRTDLTFAGLGRACYFISRGGDMSAMEALDFQLCDDPAEASFVFLAGLDADATAHRKAVEALAIAARRNLPLLCTNPDMVSIEGDLQVEGPGALAAGYAEAGHDVRYVGKPWPAIYRAALARLNLRVERIVAVGDSLHHDVDGAAAFGIDAALVTDGVHRSAFAGARNLASVVDDLAGASELRPRWLLQRFRLAASPDIKRAG